ncbi:MAG: hypothetical protein QNL61_11955 [Crocinitomicaceae bacterium]
MKLFYATFADVIAGFFLIGTIANLTMIHHPMWCAVSIVALVGFLMIRRPIVSE